MSLCCAQKKKKARIIARDGVSTCSVVLKNKKTQTPEKKKMKLRCRHITGLAEDFIVTLSQASTVMALKQAIDQHTKNGTVGKLILFFGPTQLKVFFSFAPPPPPPAPPPLKKKAHF